MALSSPKPSKNGTKSNTLNELGKSDPNASQAFESESSNTAESDSTMLLQILDELKVLKVLNHNVKVINTRLDNMEEANNEVKLMVTQIVGLNTNSAEVVPNAQDVEFQCKSAVGKEEARDCRDSIEKFASDADSDKKDVTLNSREGVKIDREEYLQNTGTTDGIGPAVTSKFEGVVENPVCTTDKFFDTVRKIEQIQVLMDEVNQVLKKVVDPNSKIAQNLNELENLSNPTGASDSEAISATNCDMEDLAVASGSGPFPKSIDDVENDKHSNETSVATQGFEAIQPQASVTKEEDRLNEPSAETLGAWNSESPDVTKPESDITSDDVFQQGLAPRDFQDGEYVFTRKRILSFPKPPSTDDLEAWWCNDSLKDPSLHDEYETCNSCYEVIPCKPRRGKNFCANCGWPVHSNDPVTPLQLTSCQQKHEQDCGDFVANHCVYKNFTSERKTAPFVLGVFYAMLLPKEPKEKLLNLPESMPNNDPIVKRIFEDSIRFVRKMKHCKSISDEDLNKIIRIICSNVLNPPATYPCFSYKKKLIFSIYEGPSIGRLLPHDCNPNCEIYLNPETLDAVIKTTRTVQKGEKLTISYIESIFPKPVHERAKDLAAIFMPPCTCSTCKDPTEGDTYGSAIQIPKDRRKKGKKSKRPCEYAVPYRISKSKSTTGDAARFEWNCECKRCLVKPISQAFVENLIKDVNKARIGVKDFNLKSVLIPKSVDTKFYPNHAALVPIFVGMGLYAVQEVEKCMQFTSVFVFNYDLDYYYDIQTAVGILSTYGHTRQEDYRILLLYRALLRINQLSFRKSFNILTWDDEEFSKALKSLIDDLDKCSELKKRNPFREKNNFFIRLPEEDCILSFTVPLINVVFNEAKKFCKLPVFTDFCDRYNKKSGEEAAS